MSYARTISISDHHRRRKRLLNFNQRHQDKAFHFLKLLVIFLKKTKSIFVRRDYPARKYFKNNSIKGDFFIIEYRKFERE